MLVLACSRFTPVLLLVLAHAQACMLGQACMLEDPNTSNKRAIQQFSAKNRDENRCMRKIFNSKVPTKSARMCGFSSQFLDNQPENCCTTTAYSFVCFFIFIRMLLVWDVMGDVMGVVWGVANFTALGNPEIGI